MSKIDSTIQRRATRALAILLCAGCAMPALAQPQDAQRHDPGALAVAAFLQDAQARRDANPDSFDGTPPVLHKLDVTGSVNAQALDQFVTVQAKVTDNLSGVASYLIEFRSPSGQQHVARVKTAPAPQPNLTALLTVGATPFSDPPFEKFAEPGYWVADYFMAMDAAGNVVTYNESQLHSHGNTEFFVTNNGGYDITPPQVASGLIDTPNVRLSKAPPGLPDGTPPFVSAEVSMTDTGNGAVSGSFEGYLKFCLASCSDSFVMYGRTNRTGLVANTLTVGAQLRRGQTPGNYSIYSLEMIDVAGSSRTLVGTDFGGGTNFHSLFAQGANVFLNQ